MSESVEQIVVELVRDEDDSLIWSWGVFGADKHLSGGVGLTLSGCLDAMRQFLRDEGIAP